MIHAKAVLIDDELARAGSANLDGRSLFLSYEMTIAFYDRQAVYANAVLPLRFPFTPPVNNRGTALLGVRVQEFRERDKSCERENR